MKTNIFALSLKEKKPFLTKMVIQDEFIILKTPQTSFSGTIKQFEMITGISKQTALKMELCCGGHGIKFPSPYGWNYLDSSKLIPFLHPMDQEEPI
ncbi:hypothetical protein [Gluconobacter cerinus]|uniref:hypothetical protein n=1 Tax=Gluconobacter cerinus TaxID=38307 RepID=UPI001B8C0E02|nr:hypothetical protein [Gluconobacter cerinus]MBS1038105.1 hypothetical protein [Gluconobacter cerinus]